MPPDAPSAERGLLGSMLRDQTVIGHVARVVRTSHFSGSAHRKVFAAMVELFDRGYPVDLVTVAERLKSSNSIEDIGGYIYLAELWDASPTTANVEYYARLVRDRATEDRDAAGQ